MTALSQGGLEFLLAEPGFASAEHREVGQFLAYLHSVLGFRYTRGMGPNFPSIELLQANHRFPTLYCMKVIGDADAGFIARVVERARICLQAEQSPKYTFRQTKDGKHVAVTLDIPAEAPQQILDVYQGLASETGVRMLL